LAVSGEAYNIKGICWNPVAQGYKQYDGLIFKPKSPAYSLDLVERDLGLIRDAGFNTIRTYTPITDTSVLNLIDSYGLKVIISVCNFHKITNEEIKATIMALKDHPTTLLWEVGNEWNYNNFYNPNGTFDESLARLQEIIALIRSLDDQHLIATNYGELPSKETELALDVDLWGLNIYRTDSFDDVFEIWEGLSDKPLYIGEYGADSIDNRKGDGRYAPEDQTYAVKKLTQLIIDKYASEGRGPLVGGALFEFNDEWWKDGKGLPDEHDIGGIAPGGGPYPDREFNEEWWGIVDIDRVPRPAYYAIQELYRE
tara:strand:+ start:2816 stop:3751 length:936 start_codon:yes stop_codon:yes gene_type:complete